MKKDIFFSDLKDNLFNLLRKFRRKYCNAENAGDAELGAINFCCAEDAQICAYKKTCCVGNPSFIWTEVKKKLEPTPCFLNRCYLGWKHSTLLFLEVHLLLVCRFWQLTIFINRAGISVLSAVCMWVIFSIVNCISNLWIALFISISLMKN